MRRAGLISLVLAFGCKAGDVGTGDQPGLAKPVETDQPAGGVPIPGEGAASPTTPVEVDEPADTPAAASTAEDDPWEATSTDPWATTRALEDVTAIPALPETDPWASPADAKLETKIEKEKKKKLRGPIR